MINMKILDKIKYHGETYIIQEIIKREEIGCFTTLDITAHLCQDNDNVKIYPNAVATTTPTVTLYNDEQN